MNHTMPALRDLAEQIFAQEAATGQKHAQRDATETRAFGRIRIHMSKFFGAAGYLALLNRALALTALETPRLICFSVLADGSLEIAGQADSDNPATGSSALLAQLLGLLVTFIGEAMTQCLMQEIWPEVSLEFSLNAQPPDKEATL